MKVEQIKSAIVNGTFTNDDINVLVEAIKYARSQLGRQVKRSISVGDRVEFEDRRIGYVHQGTVSKINIKYIIVNTPKGNFRVPASMLTVV
jgi:ferredoxin-fold anticodon binding domain-containing protein